MSLTRRLSAGPLDPQTALAAPAAALAGAGTAVALAPPSLLSRGRVRVAMSMFGPAFVASVAYVDPGNFSTNFTAGAKYGYALVWVVLAANLMAMPVQFLSAKVGIVTGRSLPQVCRDRCHPIVRGAMWVQAEIVTMATDLAEFVGAAIGLNLLFGVDPVSAGLITAVAAFALLGLQSRGYRPFERAMVALMTLILAGFAYDLFTVGGGPRDLPATLIPDLGGPGMVYLAAGITGATMMPHVVYLHSEMTRARVPVLDDADRRSVLRFERLDVVVALGIAGLINLSMLVIAARLLYGGGDVDLTGVHSALAHEVGGVAALLFAVALLASGISSSSVGTYAGQAVMSGFTTLKLPLLLRRSLTMAPALLVLVAGVNLTAVLNFSQVLLSFGIPFALVPLVLVTSSRRIMGAFVSPRWLTVTMSVVTAGVTAVNLALVVQALG